MVFEAALKAELSFSRMALALITQQFKDIGIDLTRSQRAAVKTRLDAVQGDDLVLDLGISEAQLRRSTLTEEQRAAGRIVVELDPANFLASFEEKIPTIVLAYVEKAGGLCSRGEIVTPREC